MGTNSEGGFQPEKRLENLRPQAIYDALLLREIGTDESLFSKMATRPFSTRRNTALISPITNWPSSERTERVVLVAQDFLQSDGPAAPPAIDL